MEMEATRQRYAIINVAFMNSFGPFNAISMCSVLCEKVQRADLLAMLVDHRRVAKTVEAATRRAMAVHA